jgi:hypothetical protein
MPIKNILVPTVSAVLKTTFGVPVTRSWLGSRAAPRSTLL